MIKIQKQTRDLFLVNTTRSAEAEAMSVGGLAGSVSGAGTLDLGTVSSGPTLDAEMT